MKRAFASLICAVLLLALLPAAVAPARMAFSYSLHLAGANALVGSTVQAAITNVQSAGPYQYAFKLYRKTNEGYAFAKDVPGMTTSSTTSFQVGEPGVYILYTVVWSAADSALLWSPEFTVALRPAAHVTDVSPVNGTALKVTWTAVAGASGYEVWRAESAAGPYTIVKWTNATSFSNTYLTPGKRYYYKVGAYNIVDSVKCVSGLVGAANAGVPLAKASVTQAVATGKDRIKLAWAAVPGASGYQVLMATAAAGPYAPVLTTSALGATKTGLLANKAYWFKVRAYKRIYTTNYYGPLSGYRSVRTLP